MAEGSQGPSSLGFGRDQIQDRRPSLQTTTSCRFTAAVLQRGLTEEALSPLRPPPRPAGPSQLDGQQDPVHSRPTLPWARCSDYRHRPLRPRVSSGFLGVHQCFSHPGPTLARLTPLGHEPRGTCLCSSHYTECPQYGQPAARLPWRLLNTGEENQRLSPGTWDQAAKAVPPSLFPQGPKAPAAPGEVSGLLTGPRGAGHAARCCSPVPVTHPAAFRKFSAALYLASNTDDTIALQPGVPAGRQWDPPSLPRLLCCLPPHPGGRRPLGLALSTRWASPPLAPANPTSPAGEKCCPLLLTERTSA